jgi:hypothetical protein
VNAALVVNLSMGRASGKSTITAVSADIRGCHMSQSDNTRMRRLMQISIDLRDQMAEVHKLRNSLQLAENATRGKWPTDAGVVSDHQPRLNKMRLR